MSQIANITVFDGAAAPVSHTLVAISVSKTGNTIVSEWREKAVGVPDYAQVNVTQKRELMKSGVIRTETTVVVPVMESILNQNAAGYTAAPKVAYEDKHSYVSYAHPRSTITGRRLARQMLVNLSGNISTSVAPASAGFVPELVDQLVSPT